MIFDQEVSHYTALDVPTDASPQEIKSAYLRAKHLYRKDNHGLYGMLDAEATEDALRKIEEAFQVLSNPELKSEYDAKSGVHSREAADLLVASATHRRSSQMDGKSKDPFQAGQDSLGSSDDLESLLNPPSTDFATPVPAVLNTPKSMAPEAKTEVKNVPNASSFDFGRGMMIRKVRETKRISLEDMSFQTKISKNYLTSIEEEDYSKLPAPVFVRGFIMQIAKILKLDGATLASQYIEHLKKTASS